MTTLVLTVVGGDRAGLVAEVADMVAAHGGNWEHSRLAELSGAFAGIIEVSVPAARVDGLYEALGALDGLVAIAAVAAGTSAEVHDARRFSFQVLGNDRPGIVKEVTSTLAALGVGVERMATETRDAAMAGGRLFEAVIVATVPATVDVSQVQAELERLATEIQVDVSLGDTSHEIPTP